MPLQKMKILAIETSEKVATVAAAENERIVATQTCDPLVRSAQSLMPGIQQLLRTVQWRPHEVDLVGVSAGPGSFTGLRVGVVTAKVLAYAVGAEVLGIDTLEAIAAGAPAGVNQLWTAIDCQRGQWVVQPFKRAGDGWPKALAPAKIVDAELWLAGLDTTSPLAGPVLHKARGRIPCHVDLLAPEFWSPVASCVATLAARDYIAGRRDDLWALAPRYSRPSAAEEKLH